MPSFGLIVEGPTDAEAFLKLTPRADTPGSRVYALHAGGKPALMRTFPTLLQRFNHIHNGGPVNKALVILDCDGSPIDDVRARMQQRLGNRTYPFTVELCVVRRSLDTWLLADHNAVNAVAARRGGREAGPVHGQLEEIVDAKTRLMKMLHEARLAYSPEVLGEIANVIDLDALRYRTPSFIDFEQRVNAGLL